MLLTNSEINAILNSPKRNAKGLSKGYMILQDGTMVPYEGSMLGGFEGKQGTKRRSKKGRVRTLPNGTRRYVANPDVLRENEIIAYKRRQA
jgi:hypothetical protein